MSHLIPDPLPQNALHHAVTCGRPVGAGRDRNGRLLTGRRSSGPAAHTSRPHGVGSFAPSSEGPRNTLKGSVDRPSCLQLRVNSESRPHPVLGTMSAILEWSGKVGRGFLPLGEGGFAQDLVHCETLGSQKSRARG